MVNAISLLIHDVFYRRFPFNKYIDQLKPFLHIKKSDLKLILDMYVIRLINVEKQETDEERVKTYHFEKV